MAILALVVALILLLVFGFWLVGSLIGLAIMLAVAALVGWLADVVVPGETPYGWLGLALVGLVGGWLGVALFGHWGPNLFGLWLGPAFLGAVILTFVISVLAGRRTRRGF